MIILITGLVLAWWALRQVGSGRWGRAVFAVGIGLVTCLFLIHKASPDGWIMTLRGAGRLWTIKTIMMAVGFSYVALSLCRRS